MDDRTVEQRLLNMLERLESNTMSENVKFKIMNLDINENDNTMANEYSPDFAEQCMFLGWYILTQLVDYPES